MIGMSSGSGSVVGLFTSGGDSLEGRAWDWKMHFQMAEVKPVRTLETEIDDKIYKAKELSSQEFFNPRQCSFENFLTRFQQPINPYIRSQSNQSESPTLIIYSCLT